MRRSKRAAFSCAMRSPSDKKLTAKPDSDCCRVSRVRSQPWIDGNPGSQKTATAGVCDCEAESTSGSALTTAALPIVFRNFLLGRLATDNTDYADQTLTCPRESRY